MREPRVTRGQSLAEFALLLPIFAFLLVGVVDFARAFYAGVSIANASRVAAEYAINYTEASGLRPPASGPDNTWRTRAGVPATTPDPCTSSMSRDDCGRARATLATQWKAAQEATNIGVSANDVTMTFSGGTSWTPNTKFTVTVNYNFEAITPLASTIWGGGPLLLTRATTLRHSCSSTSACTFP